jgi:hypothetical protein
VVRYPFDIGEVIRAGTSKAYFSNLSLTRPVYDATDDGDVDGSSNVFQSRLQFVDYTDNIEILARAAGTGYEIHSFMPQAKTLEDIKANFNLFHWIGGE